MIDHILKVTKQEQLIYCGHSQGGTIITILLSEHPEYNKKISSVHLIAGAVIMRHSTSRMMTPFVKNHKLLTVYKKKSNKIIQKNLILFHFTLEAG